MKKECFIHYSQKNIVFQLSKETVKCQLFDLNIKNKY